MRRTFLSLIAILITILCGLQSSAIAQALVVKPLAEKKISELPAGPLYWRIETLPSMERAKAVSGPTTLAVEEEGKTDAGKPFSSPAAMEAEAPELATRVCAACHGSRGVSVGDTVPNLAGQRAKYLQAQLEFFKSGIRKEPGGIARANIMNAIAAQLTDADIRALAAYFSAQPAGGGNATSPFMPNIEQTRVGFPDAYKTSFTKYATIDFPERKQVRTYYANPVALQAARDGRPLPDGSILFVEVFSGGKIVAYTAMAREGGWGDAFPSMLRNENWNYALFGPDKTLRAGANQAECLACHKPRENESYIFTLKQLTEAARR